MEISVSISYEAINNIYITVGENKKLLLSNEKKEILASEILDVLDYKKEQKYILLPLGKDVEKLDSTNKNYIQQIFEMLETIITGINNKTKDN